MQTINMLFEGPLKNVYIGKLKFIGQKGLDLKIIKTFTTVDFVKTCRLFVICKNMTYFLGLFGMWYDNKKYVLWYEYV